MANITEVDQFDANVYLIGTTDAVIGGVNGISNKQAKALANRTTWLKNVINAFGNIVSHNAVDFDSSGSAGAAQTAAINAAAPAGIISMWAGTTAPSGWHLCDGTDETPDLRGQFIVGYKSTDSDYNAIGKTGGSKTHTLTTSEMPSHSHLLERVAMDRTPDPGTNGIMIAGSNFGVKYNTTDAGSDQIADIVVNTGGGAAHESRPPFYTLAYIIKL